MSSLREVPGKMFQLAENRQEAGRELRDCVVETLQELMKDDDKITALEADLGGASGFTKIKKTNPERFIQCGIAEANMMGVAAGLSLTGFKPFTHTFAPFATRRVFDQLFYPVHMQEIQSMFMAQIQDLVWHPMVELIQRGKM